MQTFQDINYEIGIAIESLCKIAGQTFTPVKSDLSLILKPDCLTEIAMHYDKKEVNKKFLSEFLAVNKFNKKYLAKAIYALSNILFDNSKSISSEHHQDFLNSAAKILYNERSYWIKTQPLPLPHVPKELEKLEVVDLASGIYADLLMSGLENRITHRFVDSSPFVCTYLNLVAKNLNLNNIIVDSSKVEDFKSANSSISTLRIKNVDTYVPDTYLRIKEFSDWIAPGGLLLFQMNRAHAHTQNFFNLYEDSIISLIKDGWVPIINEYLIESLMYDSLPLLTVALEKPSDNQRPSVHDCLEMWHSVYNFIDHEGLFAELGVPSGLGIRLNF